MKGMSEHNHALKASPKIPIYFFTRPDKKSNHSLTCVLVVVAYPPLPSPPPCFAQSLQTQQHVLYLGRILLKLYGTLSLRNPWMLAMPLPRLTLATTQPSPNVNYSIVNSLGLRRFKLSSSCQRKQNLELFKYSGAEHSLAQ